MASNTCILYIVVSTSTIIYFISIYISISILIGHHIVHIEFPRRSKPRLALAILPPSPLTPRLHTSLGRTLHPIPVPYPFRLLSLHESGGLYLSKRGSIFCCLFARLGLLGSPVL